MSVPPAVCLQASGTSRRTSLLRHHLGLKALLTEWALLTDIVPGVTWRGDDIGRWLTRRERDFGRLNTEQQKRLAELVVRPAVHAHKTSAQSEARLVRAGCGGIHGGLAWLRRC
ncbi:hypothetical protein [Streptomyces sp. NPDC001415]